jgi:hypothetical protein
MAALAIVVPVSRATIKWSPVRPVTMEEVKKLADFIGKGLVE